jgi:2-keto-4-pentenoate hydratase/2-oxohepta-3-ene-1,7-dioic acid hydratase in catechol pathway
MRLGTFVSKGAAPGQLPGQLRVGALLGDRVLDLGMGSMKQFLSLGEAGLERARKLLEAARAGKHADGLHPLGSVRLLPPVPDADKFLCVGKNYRSHLAELERTALIRERPQEPTGFIKLNSCLVGHGAEVERPPSVAHLDYEPELVFVLGRPAFRAKRDNALDYVAGITLLNDLTCRDTQKREVDSGSRFWTAKNAPGFGPLGPWIITMDEVRDPYDIWVTCSVNGEQRMRVNTRDQIWKLPDIIEHFSRLLPLVPGDMFSTGAPGGVAVGKPNAAELFLKPGDVVECAFEEPAMVLSTRIVQR